MGRGPIIGGVPFCGSHYWGGSQFRSEFLPPPLSITWDSHGEGHEEGGSKVIGFGGVTWFGALTLLTRRPGPPLQFRPFLDSGDTKLRGGPPRCLCVGGPFLTPPPLPPHTRNIRSNSGPSTLLQARISHPITQFSPPPVPQCTAAGGAPPSAGPSSPWCVTSPRGRGGLGKEGCCHGYGGARLVAMATGSFP